MLEPRRPEAKTDLRHELQTFSELPSATGKREKRIWGTKISFPSRKQRAELENLGRELGTLPGIR